MSIEWMHAHTPEVLTVGTHLRGYDEPISAPLALLFAPDGEGACIEGTKAELLAMLDAARVLLDTLPADFDTRTEDDFDNADDEADDDNEDDDLPAGQHQYTCSYSIESLNGNETVFEGETTVTAANQSQARVKAHTWVHDNDYHCDERIDPRVHVNSVERQD